MGTDVIGVDAGALLRQERIQVAMQASNCLQRIVAAGHTGLVGYHNHKKSGLIQQPDGLRRIRQKLEFLDAVHITLFHIDHTVPVQEYGLSRPGFPIFIMHAARPVRHRCQL